MPHLYGPFFCEIPGSKAIHIYISLVPRLSLDLPAFNVAHKTRREGLGMRLLLHRSLAELHLGAGGALTPLINSRPPPLPPSIKLLLSHSQGQEMPNVNNNHDVEINVVPESAPEAISGSPKCKNLLGGRACPQTPLEIVCTENSPASLDLILAMRPPPPPPPPPGKFLNEGLICIIFLQEVKSPGSVSLARE